MTIYYNEAKDLIGIYICLFGLDFVRLESGAYMTRNKNWEYIGVI